jgi:hypothetical protein
MKPGLAGKSVYHVVAKFIGIFDFTKQNGFFTFDSRAPYLTPMDFWNFWINKKENMND